MHPALAAFHFPFRGGGRFVGSDCSVTRDGARSNWQGAAKSALSTQLTTHPRGGPRPDSEKPVNSFYGVGRWWVAARAKRPSGLR
jgi:hypothetical protein